MNRKHYFLSHRLVLQAAASVALAGLFCTAAQAEFLLPNHAHSQKVRNRTGKTANDLHVNLIHPATGKKPTAPPFSPGNKGGKTIDFDGANVANGGMVTVSWESKFASDTLDPTDPGRWTFNGNSIGTFRVASQDLSPQYIDQGNGQVLVSILNTGAPVQYEDLQIWNDADAANYAPDTFVGGLGSGNPVALLVGTAGTFNNGLTDIALFSPTLDPTKYAGGSMQVADELSSNGEFDLFAHAANVPEPSTALLLTLGSFLAYCCRGKLRRAA